MTKMVTIRVESTATNPRPDEFAALVGHLLLADDFFLTSLSTSSSSSTTNATQTNSQAMEVIRLLLDESYMTQPSIFAALLAMPSPARRPKDDLFDPTHVVLCADLDGHSSPSLCHFVDQRIPLPVSSHQNFLIRWPFSRALPSSNVFA